MSKTFTPTPSSPLKKENDKQKTKKPPTGGLLLVYGCMTYHTFS